MKAADIFQTRRGYAGVVKTRRSRHMGTEKPRRGRIRASDGAISLEAALALPIFFCVVVAIAFLLRAVQVHEKVQHAISQSALEIAGISYIYGASGLSGIQDETEALFERGVGKMADTISKSVQFEDWLPQSASDEVEKQISDIAPALSERANGFLFGMYAGYVTGKYLGDETGAMNGFNISGGTDGLDFSRSSYLSNGSEDVSVSVRYTFKIPIIIEPLSRLVLSQTACARAWLYGDGVGGVDWDLFADEDDIWSLDNFTRGRIIRDLFHANLPFHFRGLSSFRDGVATRIHSLDTTAASYQTPAGIGKQIDGYVSELRDYNGQVKPFGREKIVILPEEITTRRLVLVIPRNEIRPEISAEIDRCIRDALAQGVILQVERYATKHFDGEEDG